MLPGKESFWDPARCEHRGFQVRCVSEYWELRVMNEDGLGGAEGVHRRKEIRLCHQGLLSPLGMGAAKEERPRQKVCYRSGNETGGLDLEEN